MSGIRNPHFNKDKQDARDAHHITEHLNIDDPEPAQVLIGLRDNITRVFPDAKVIFGGSMADRIDVGVSVVRRNSADGEIRFSLVRVVDIVELRTTAFDVAAVVADQIFRDFARKIIES